MRITLETRMSEHRGKHIASPVGASIGWIAELQSGRMA